MGTVPQRPAIARSYRWFLDAFEKHFSAKIPWVNPSWYQLVGLFLSVFILFVQSDAIASLIVATVLLLDWFDGMSARVLGLVSRKGWMLDVTVDRVSEMFMFVPFLLSGEWWWFFAGVVNILLSHYSVVTGKHRILPLRFFYLVFLIVRMVG